MYFQLITKPLSGNFLYLPIHGMAIKLTIVSAGQFIFLSYTLSCHLSCSYVSKVSVLSSEELLCSGWRELNLEWAGKQGKIGVWGGGGELDLGWGKE